MQNVAKKSHATVATALLFASLLIVPLSLKAFGISPSLSAGVAAWRHVAGIFADNYQPVNTVEMLAVNFTDEASPRDEAEPPTGALLASLQPFELQFDRTPNDTPSATKDDRTAEIAPAASPVTRRCVKSSKHVAHTPVATNLVVSVEDVRAQALKAAESTTTIVPIQREAVRNFEREMERYRVTLSEAMRVAPRDFKLMLKIKPSVSPAVTSCAFSKPLSPERVKRLRKAWSFTAEPVAESAEESELE